MTFWLDAHLKPDLSAWLGSHFKIIVKPLREIGLREAKDDVLLSAAQRFGGIVIVTKDAGLVRRVRRDAPSQQVIWLRCGNLTALETQVWLVSVFQEALDQLAAGVTIVELKGPVP